MRRRVFALAAALVAGCAPEMETDDTRVAPGQVLAVRAEPAEAAPGTPVTLSALVAGPDGSIREASLIWNVCSVRKTLTEGGAVAADCLDAPAELPDAGVVDAADAGPAAPAPGGAAPASAAVGAEVTLTVPKDACRLFGPDPPPPPAPESAAPGAAEVDAGAADAPAPGEEAPVVVSAPPRPGRPADPDYTGGYQQPIVLFTAPEAEPVVFGLRLTCGAPGATRVEAAELRRFGHANGRPSPTAFDAAVDGRAWRALPGEGANPLEVAPGARVSLRVTWPACPAVGKDACGDGICGPREDATGCAADCAMPHPCGGAERYVLLDPVSGDVRERREGLRLSWWSTAGTFEAPRTGTPAEGDDGPRGATPVTRSENVFTAPTAPGVYTLWVVMRDERGGADWRSGQIEVLADP